MPILIHFYAVHLFDFQLAISCKVDTSMLKWWLSNRSHSVSRQVPKRMDAKLESRKNRARLKWYAKKQSQQQEQS